MSVLVWGEFIEPTVGLLDLLRTPAQATSPRANAWIEDVYSLLARKQIDEAIDVLFTETERLLSKGNFSECNSLLQTIDLKRMDTNLLIALLSITLSAAQKLPYRTRLREKVEKRLRELAPARSERLLRGL